MTHSLGNVYQLWRVARRIEYDIADTQDDEEAEPYRILADATMVYKTTVANKQTPTHNPESMPYGISYHIRNGVWTQKCEHCDYYTQSDGTGDLARWQRHEWEAHGIRSKPLIVIEEATNE